MIMYFKALSTCMLHRKYRTLIFILGIILIIVALVALHVKQVVTNAFVCSLQHVEVTGREDTLNN